MCGLDDTESWNILSWEGSLGIIQPSSWHPKIPSSASLRALGSLSSTQHPLGKKKNPFSLLTIPAFLSHGFIPGGGMISNISMIDPCRAPQDSLCYLCVVPDPFPVAGQDFQAPLKALWVEFIHFWSFCDTFLSPSLSGLR